MTCLGKGCSVVFLFLDFWHGLVRDGGAMDTGGYSEYSSHPPIL